MIKIMSLISLLLLISCGNAIKEASEAASVETEPVKGEDCSSSIFGTTWYDEITKRTWLAQAAGSSRGEIRDLSSGVNCYYNTNAVAIPPLWRVEFTYLTGEGDDDTICTSHVAFYEVKKDCNLTICKGGMCYTYRPL